MSKNQELENLVTLSNSDSRRGTTFIFIFFYLFYFSCLFIYLFYFIIYLFIYFSL